MRLGTGRDQLPFRCNLTQQVVSDMLTVPPIVEIFIFLFCILKCLKQHFILINRSFANGFIDVC